jgi:folate-binding protein YgfZ
VKVADASAKLTAIGMLGPKSEEVFAHLGLSVEGMDPLEMRDTTLQGMAITLVRGDWANVPSYEIWCAPENVAKIWQLATREGATQVGYEAYEMTRIAAGRPRYGVDMNDRDLPQETNQTRALHFQKGCYVGQEIVERIHSRGQVHRRFMAFTLDHAAPVGSAIERDGKPVGELTSVATLPDGSVVGLGYIRRASESAEEQYLAGGAAVRPTVLPIAS